MRVTAFDPYISDDDFVSRGAIRVTTLDALLRGSDIITLHVPFTAETRSMISASEIAKMSRGAVVINAARGEVLDVDAALAALSRNDLGGLALDVYDPEPPTRAWPDDPRLILTPHIAGCTTEAKSAIGAKLYEKICAHYAARSL
jgi:phosphoglycerate dehydrogenase-like enzyme